MRAIAAISLGLALAVAGCASPPRDTTRASDVTVREGVPVRVVALDDDGVHAFASADGFRWHKVDADESDLAHVSTDQDRFRVTRVFESENPGRGRFCVWRQEGISWRLVTTLPDDSSLGN